MLDQLERPRLAKFVPTPRGTPFTFCYLVVLLATTLVVRLADPALTAQLLALSSTDAHNLWRRPFLALFASALWVGGDHWLPYFLIFSFLVAPLERRFKARRTAGVFFAGHVLATLLTELPVMWAISVGLLPKSDAHWLDIGVSYGFFTTAGALVFLLARRRWLAVAALELFVLEIYLADDPSSLEAGITLAGHAIAAHFGLLCCGPWLKRGLARSPKK
ncbi:rhomboid-like protein [Amycolatopsis sp. NPDC059657]|uniref:rhomboid-like protein n=1 Tax=Amycolatopsis sp. NPDC059657 TaxID=3346899 RepID=UPI00367302E3